MAERSVNTSAVRSCRRCGCTAFDACVDPVLGPCFWVDDDLCSHCVARTKTRAAWVAGVALGFAAALVTVLAIRAATHAW
jgi:hypothetical protein